MALEGKAEGSGKLTFPDGSVYEGEFKNGKYQGYGVYIKESKPKPAKYQGEWVNGLYHGKGIFFWPNGSIYEGTHNSS